MKEKQTLKNSSNKNNSSAVNCFFRLYENQNDEENWDDLEEICERIWEEEEISKTTFPFADDAGGNIICMSLNKEDYGTIVNVNLLFYHLQQYILLIRSLKKKKLDI